MSLISQQDRELAIVAFENYIEHLQTELHFLSEEDEQYEEYTSELYQSNTLLNWIKLEHYKNEH